MSMTTRLPDSPKQKAEEEDGPAEKSIERPFWQELGLPSEPKFRPQADAPALDTNLLERLARLDPDLTEAETHEAYVNIASFRNWSSKYADIMASAFLRNGGDQTNGQEPD